MTPWEGLDLADLVARTLDGIPAGIFGLRVNDYTWSEIAAHLGLDEQAVQVLYHAACEELLRPLSVRRCAPRSW